MNKAAITLSLILLLTAVAFANDYLIVPGRSVGNITIGAYNMDYVEGWLGPPECKTVDEYGYKLSYSETYGLSLSFSLKTKILDTIYIWNSTYHTSEGICVGSFMLDAEKYYKGYYSKEFYLCKGINFGFDKVTGKIKMIAVDR